MPEQEVSYETITLRVPVRASDPPARMWDWTALVDAGDPVVVVDIASAPLVRDDDGATWQPWTNGWAVGFRVVSSTGVTRFVYLNPSGGSDDGVPTVFLYSGDAGDPAIDGPSTHIAPFS